MGGGGGGRGGAGKGEGLYILVLFTNIGQQGKSFRELYEKSSDLPG